MLAASKQHDITAIIANSYSENPHRMSIEQARKMLSEKKQYIVIDWGDQQILKYLEINTSIRLSIK